MHGMPKRLNTKADFERVHALTKAGKIPVKEMIKQWNGLYNSRNKYAFDRTLSEDENPDGGEPDYRVMTEEREDGTVLRQQFKLEENPSGRIFKLGYTVNEVQAKLTELGE